MAGELFKGIKQWEFEREDLKFKLPVFYYDNTSLTAIYTASTGKIRELLPHSDMRPLEVYPGKGLVVFTAFEYRKTDIGPYNEFSIAFPIEFGTRPIPWLTPLWRMARRRVSAYVWQLPVTTEIARMGGVELYGYPKFLADITFKKGGDWMACTLSENGQKILSLRGERLPTQRGKISRVLTYSMIDGIPLVANVLIDPIEFAESRKKDSAILELGTGHPIANTLRGMDLSGALVGYQYCPMTQAVLFAGRNLADR